MTSRFLKNDEGSVTIEFVLWVPVFAVLLMVVLDASMVYLTMSRMENAARDGVRRISIGQVSPAEIAPIVLSSLDDAPYTVDADCSTSNYACLNISRPIDSIVTFTVLNQLIGETIAAEIRMRLEPGVAL